MYVHLPFPYPDELLYSVVARFCFHYRLNFRSVLRALSGKPFMRPDLPASLDAISKKTYLLWAMKGEDILQKMTLFPFYQPFLIRSRDSAEFYLGRSEGYRGSIGQKCYRVTHPTYLRLCRLCVSEEFARYGEAYWHRIHQVPGVVVCPVHGLPLSISDIGLIYPLNRNLVPGIIIEGCTYSSEEKVLMKDLFLLKRIAARCNEILLGELGDWEAEDLRALYIDRALQRGFESVRGVFSGKRLEQELLEYYGVSLLNTIGISRNDNGWARSPFCRPSGTQSIHPLEHVLVQIFLESMPVVGVGKPFGIGPWKCPNPFGGHGDEAPIEKIRIRTNLQQEVYARAQCRCGFKFCFSEVASNDPHMPVIKEISAYGPTWQTEAWRLKGKGFSIKEIAREMSISYASANNLLKTQVSQTAVTPQLISEARALWIKEVKRHGGRVTATRKENYGLYQYLRKYDHDWMMAHRVPRSPRVNWRKRDREWKNKLEQVAKENVASGTSSQLAPSKLVKDAGLNLRIFTQLHRLPLCRQAIEKYSRYAWRVKRPKNG